MEHHDDQCIRTSLKSFSVDTDVPQAVCGVFTTPVTVLLAYYKHFHVCFAQLWSGSIVSTCDPVESRRHELDHS